MEPIGFQIKTGNYIINVVYEFVYLGSTFTKLLCQITLAKIYYYCRSRQLTNSPLSRDIQLASNMLLGSMDAVLIRCGCFRKI